MQKREMGEEEARFIVASTLNEDNKTEMLAFAHFRFLVEGECEVLYVYELQVAPSAKRKGLGKHMMCLLEMIARKYGMKFVMLTVFTENSGGMEFYRNLKYIVDETSPQFNDLGQDEKSAATYQILSKEIHYKN